MFYSSSDHLHLLIGSSEDTENRHVIALGTATGEDDFGGIRPEEIGYLTASRINVLLNLAAEVVHAGWVSP